MPTARIVDPGTHDHDHESEFHEDIIYPATIPFLLVHLACFAAIWTGVTTQALIVCVVLYVVRMFGVTGGYHRYFSHRSFKTSRVGQFLLAVLAQSSAQRGALWWAAKHRHHHRHSDTELDVHSPRHHGFLYAHLGWIFKRDQTKIDYDQVPDLARYPELVWLEKYPLVPPVILAVGIWFWMGWVGLVVGFFWSTVLLYHGTFMINSLAHVHGKQRYITGDDSRNNWWLALITLGEGWHNNHHAYQSATRQGFRWYEVDITYYTLKALSWVGIVWDLREPPEAVVRGDQRLGRKVVEKVAHQLAHRFPVERLTQQVRARIAQMPDYAEIVEMARTARSQAEERLAAVHLPDLPEVPSLDEIRAEAQRVWSERVPDISMEDIVDRAHEILVETVSERLVGQLRAARV